MPTSNILKVQVGTKYLTKMIGLYFLSNRCRTVLATNQSLQRNVCLEHEFVLTAYADSITVYHIGWWLVRNVYD